MSWDNLLDITCGCYSTYYIEYYYLILIVITHIMLYKISDSDSDSDYIEAKTSFLVPF